MKNNSNPAIKVEEHGGFWQKFISGLFSGFTTGLVVAPLEGLKVKEQATIPGEIKKISYRDVAKKLAKGTPPFATIFGGVCALEFSVNNQIGKDYGTVSGLVASAMTGSVALTAADHLMLRNIRLHEKPMQSLVNLNKVSPSALWTGFTPMVGREFLFMLSVMILGPQIGKLIQRFQNEEQLSAQSTYSGRLISGLFTTAASHPLDTLARKMQNARIDEPHLKPSLIREITRSSLPSLMRGVIPRLGLASFGGATAGFFFDVFFTLLSSENQNAKMEPANNKNSDPKSANTTTPLLEQRSMTAGH